MASWVFLSVIQSLSRIQNIVVVPSKNQVTVHPQTGKRERIFVDLAAVYPTPEEPGTELSFEEIMATNRGWLDYCWEEESFDMSLIPDPVNEISNGVGEKLVIHQDLVLFDENGAVQEPPRESHGGKKKVLEVNETQISESHIRQP